MGCEHLQVGDVYGISMLGVNRRVIVVDINAKLDKVIIVPISSLDRAFFRYDLWTRRGVFQCWNMRVIPMRAFDKFEYRTRLSSKQTFTSLIEAVTRLLLGFQITYPDDAFELFEPSQETDEDTQRRSNFQLIEKNTFDMLVAMIS